MSLLRTLKKLQKARKELSGLIQTAAVMFVDLAQSTIYKSEKGMELGVEKVVSFNLDVTHIVRTKAEEYRRKRAIDRYEICKYIGDEVMSYFTGRDSCRVAVEVGMEIQRYFKGLSAKTRGDLEKYKPKIGVEFGDVLFARYQRHAPLDPHGLVVDKAARIVRLAKPQQILISGEVARGVPKELSRWISEAERRGLRGVKGEVELREVVWDDDLGKLGVSFEDEHAVTVISANEPTVFRFMEDRGLIASSRQVDLWLYTYETLAPSLREKLEESERPLSLRVLIRNPVKDSRKDVNIKSSVRNMQEVMSVNPKVRFDVRFYDEDPLLRTYIFHKDSGEMEGLLGLYRYDPHHEMRFVGAEGNRLIHAAGRSVFEQYLLELFHGRFEHRWSELTELRGVMFDLDGVLMDSMPYYWQSWREAFRRVSVDIVERDVYEREGERAEVTARELYRKYAGKDPTRDEVKQILDIQARVFRRVFKIVLFEGVSELLMLLKAKQVKLALVTGSRSVKESFREHKDLLDLFDAIVSGEEGANGKPSPEPYQAGVARLGLPASSCYVVENSPLGIKSAEAAGLTCFGVKNNSPLSDQALTEAGADIVCQDLGEVRKYLLWADTNIPMKSFLRVFGHVFR